MTAITKKIKSYLLNNARRQLDKKYLYQIRKNDGLWKELSSYLTKSEFTGCSYSDYWEIYSFVRNKKPKEILECGTGVSTVVMTYALMENEKEGYRGRITSMESVEKYYEMARKLLPAHMTSYADLICSPVVEDYYSLFRGVRYRDVPIDRNYDFVYVDGPSYVAPSDGTITFDFDYLHIVKNSPNSVCAIIDKRVSTCYVFQKIFGLEKVRYNAFRHLGFAGPCSKKDIKHFDTTTPSSAFDESFRVFGNTKLNLKW
jgi:hypothetical protein